MRFIRLASRYEEDVLGMTTIGYPSTVFSEGPGDSSQLGSGMVFLDEAAGAREVTANASRIEGWRRTQTYHYFQEVRRRSTVKFSPYTRAKFVMGGLTGFPKRSGNERHPRFRFAPPTTPTAACQTDAGWGGGGDYTDDGREYSDVRPSRGGALGFLIPYNMNSPPNPVHPSVQLLAVLPPHVGGLLPLSFGLLHQQEVIRELTVDLFTHIRMFPVSIVMLSFSSLNRHVVSAHLV